MDMLGIGQRIRKQREQLGYTRERLAELLDVTPKFCSDIELGVKGMSIKTLINISQTLRLPTDYILFGSNTMEVESSAVLMLRTCPSKLMPYLETLIRTFLMAVDNS